MIGINDKEYKLLTDFILRHYGIKFGQHKKSLVMGRLQTILMKSNFNSFTDYYEHIISDKTGNAIATLVDKITTNHTYFMREPSHFYYFRDTVLPYLERTVRNKDLRIWSAGCSTGEEAYTLAMIMQDYFGDAKPLWDTRILATDISGRVLDIAKKGIYKKSAIETLPKRWKNKYFRRIDGERVAVIDKIRSEVIFRSFNLMNAHFPFKKHFHVIFCRNVMIYFDVSKKNELVGKFYDCLEPGGYLFVGHSESLTREAKGFKYAMPAVYRKE